MKISVIAPVYKVEPYLRRCVDSILAQTFRDFELILVDDGSPDRCGDICDEYAKKDARVVVIHQKNGGLSAARNAGIDWAFANSDSNYLTFIDSDDWVARNYLEELIRGVCDGDVSCLFFQRVTPDTVVSKDAVVEWEKMSPKDFWLRHGWTIAWGKLYAKHLFSSIRFPVGRIHEDEFVTHRVIFQCKSVSVSEAELYKYFQRSESITGRGGDSLDLILAAEDQISFFSGLEDDQLVSFSKNRLLNAYTDAIKFGHDQYRKKIRWLLQELKKPFAQCKREYCAAYPIAAQIVWPFVHSWDVYNRRGLLGSLQRIFHKINSGV